MSHNQPEEVDIFYILNKIREVFYRFNAIVFKGIDFVKRQWLILIALILIGVAFGYYKSKDEMRDKEATLILRINFDAADYVYNTLDLIIKKVGQKDEKFLKKMGFDPENPEIISFEIKPIVTVKEIVNQYEVNNRNFETVLKNIDFKVDEEEINVLETFNSTYKFHVLEVALTHSASPETLNKIISFLNQNSTYQELKEVVVRETKEHIKEDKNTIRQINEVLDTYADGKTLKTDNTQILVVDKNFDIHKVIEKKVELQEEIEGLSKFLVYLKDTVVIINQPEVNYINKGLLGKKIVFYPVVAVFLFLFLAFIYSMFKTLERKAKELNQQ